MPSIFAHKFYNKGDKSQKTKRYERVMKRGSIQNNSNDVADDSDDKENLDDNEEENEPGMMID